MIKTIATILCLAFFFIGAAFGITFYQMKVRQEVNEIARIGAQVDSLYYVLQLEHAQYDEAICWLIEKSPQTIVETNSQLPDSIASSKIIQDFLIRAQEKIRQGG